MANELNEMKKKRFSFRSLIILPFIFQIVLFVLLVGFISFRNSESLVREMVTNLSSEISLRIEGQLEAFLSRPHRLNALTEDLVSGRILNFRDPEALQYFFLHLVQANPAVTSMYFGNTEGGIAGAGREGKENLYYVTGSPGFKAGAFRKYETEDNARAGKLLADVSGFDVRSRPWFKNAEAKGGPVWSGAYILTTGQDMAIAASHPVYDADQHFLGVVSIDLFFSHVSAFFKSLTFGKTGVGYVVERSGFLIASSTDSKLFKEAASGKERTRLAAVDCSNPVVSASAKHLVKRFAGFENVDKKSLIDFSDEGKRYFLFVSPVSDPYGIDWLTIVVIPKADFTAQIEANLRSTVFLVLIALLSAILVGILTSKAVVRSLIRLAGRSQAMAAGVWGTPLTPSRIKEIDELNASFNRMTEALKRSEESLYENQQRLDLALKGADLGTWDWNIQTGEVHFNQRWAEMLGYSLDELAPNVDTWKRLLCPEDEPFVYGLLGAHLEGKLPFYESEHRLLAKSGEWIWVLDKGKVTHRDAEGKPLRAVGTHLDITARKKAEAQLRGLLEEKDMLLRELQHRVKNNLVMIDSLLHIEIMDLEDEKAISILKETRTRLRSMAGIYEVLYKSAGGDKVDLRQYIGNLMAYLSQTYQTGERRVAFSVEFDDLKLDLKNAVPLGLILNELVTNALKYAFPNGAKGKILIEVKKRENNEVRLSVTDDGVGLPEGFEPEKVTSLGFRLVYLLARQLKGVVSAERNEPQGTSIVVNFAHLG